MMAGSHVVVAVAAWTWAAPHLGAPSLDPLALGLATIGAMLPDIDHPSSWIGRRLRLISRPLAATFGHRGVTHSMVAVLACLVVLHWQGLQSRVDRSARGRLPVTSGRRPADDERSASGLAVPAASEHRALPHRLPD